MQLGRSVIYTDQKFINRDNILDVLQKAYNKHVTNATDIDRLIKYDCGEVNPVHEKSYRDDIENFVPDPIANFIVEFKLGFEWGNPITFVQSDDDDVEDNELLTKAISLLNQNYRSAKIKTKQQELARFVEIGGVGYSYVDVNTEWDDGDSYFTLDVLDPRFAFVVRSNAYTDKRIVLGVSYRITEEKKKLFTCFTRDERFEITNIETIDDIQMNPLGKIPIVEWIRSYDRQGCFERLIPLIDSVTAGRSSFVDGVQQNVDTIWWGSDVEFPVQTVEDEEGNQIEIPVKPKDGDWLLTETTRDGRKPEVKPLTVDYDYEGQLKYISSTLSHILTLAHVPQRNDNSGGSTGVAMDDAAGWTDAEADASRKEMLSNDSKMDELKLVMSVCRISPNISQDSPLLSLKYSDCAPNFKRSKTYDLTTKINAICTGLKHGFALEDLLANIALFEDSSQVVARSGEGVRRYQETVWNDKNDPEEAVNSERMQADLSDQIENSTALKNG